MADDPLAQLFATWKQATDGYLEAWNKSLASWQQSQTGETVTNEARQTALGAQAAAAEVSRQAFEPMIAMAGGVPLAEFRRLMDHVHGLHLRMDRIDDQLRELTAEKRKRGKKARKKPAN